jgi:hypothetical protein
MPRPGADRCERFDRHGVSAGIIPTNGGEVCWAGLKPTRWTSPSHAP